MSFSTCDGCETLRAELETSDLVIERLRTENDAMRQLFQVWLLADSLSQDERDELVRRTAALGGKREVCHG